jgi:LPXTG-motif cell wall-anchored protein
MRKNTVRGLVATLSLVAASATGAFADLNLQITGGQQVPNSFDITLAAIVVNGNLATGPFNQIRAYQLGVTTLTNVNGTFNIGSVRFEDFSEFPVVPPDDTHRAIQSFVWVDGSNGIMGNTWAQTVPVPPALGTTTLTNEIRAAGNLIPMGPGVVGGILGFSIFFEGDISNGTHFQIEFWNNNSFVGAYDVRYILRNGQTLADSAFSPVATPIPLPPAVWSGLAMMAGFGVFLTKRRRDRKTLS